MVLQAGDASGVEEQRAEGEECYENDGHRTEIGGAAVLEVAKRKSAECRRLACRVARVDSW